jgi:hypothetical protein
LESSLAPNRIFNAISIRPSRRLRNSLRSDILAARQSRIPSKGISGRLNLQWSLRPSHIDLLTILNISIINTTEKISLYFKGGNMKEAIQFKLNDKPLRLTVDSERMLLWVLRTDLALTGTKYGCGEGFCGACVFSKHPA